MTMSPSISNIYPEKLLSSQPVVLAYSGGLDTSFCTAFLSKTCKAKVHAVCVDTGGFSEEKKKQIQSRAKQYGAASFQFVDGRAELFAHYIRFLLFANALRGGTYPLCAGVERYVIAQVAAEEAAKTKAKAIAHGSTGAGNDQIRFDVAFGVLAPHLPVLTPVRELSLLRQAELDWLAANGFSADFKKAEYSINEGLWGTTIGGAETKGSMGLPPEHAYTKTVSIEKAPDKGAEVVIAFEKGVPVSLNDQKLAPVALIDSLNTIAGAQGVGRGTHLGDTILGIKGRIAFEAPAAITLIAAHRELEKLVLTKQQAHLKETSGAHYAALLHEGLYFDPACRDLEAMLTSSQARVTGTVRVKLQKGNIILIGSESPYSLLSAKTAVYGEENRLWTGAEAAGFGKIYGMQSRLAGQAAQGAKGSSAPKSK